MRKLKLQVQMSVDSYVAGPNGEMDWMVLDWDDDLEAYVDELTDSVETILLGRKMTEGFISHWSTVATDPDDPSHAFGKKMMEYSKVVFTNTLDKSEWPNTNLAKGDLAEEVNTLKKQNGKDIIVYGVAGFVSSLIEAGLIDEYHLLVNPTALGTGLTIFDGLEQTQALNLVRAQPFSCGITLLNYEPASE